VYAAGGIEGATAILNSFGHVNLGIEAVKQAAAAAVAPHLDPYAEVVKLLVAAGAVE
jgi:hypothetical protein